MLNHQVSSKRSAVVIAGLCLWGLCTPAWGTSLGLYVFSLGGADPDVANEQLGPTTALVTTVGAGLGANGLPVVNDIGKSIFHDVDPITGELLWWSTSNPNVSVLNNPVYPSVVSLPFLNNAMFTNSTVFGVDGDDETAFLTAMFVGNLNLTQTGSISLNLCSDDDGLVYLSGGVFGSGTLVLTNEGVHGANCTAENANTEMMQNMAPGSYQMRVFYADREATEAVFSLRLHTDPRGLLACDVPEPSTLAISGLGLGLVWLAARRRAKSSAC
ncbi:MAG: PEP-CTERM sorting domain-containing protein [Acidobacteria bacterium]|nr:PEP-CTERM sorting domain-containing protein [Acidobacteriota bacterium]